MIITRNVQKAIQLRKSFHCALNESSHLGRYLQLLSLVSFHGYINFRLNVETKVFSAVIECMVYCMKISLQPQEIVDDFLGCL